MPSVHGCSQHLLANSMHVPHKALARCGPWPLSALLDLLHTPFPAPAVQPLDATLRAVPAYLRPPCGAAQEQAEDLPVWSPTDTCNWMNAVQEIALVSSQPATAAAFSCCTADLHSGHR